MTTDLLVCHQCQAPLPSEWAASREDSSCPACDSPVTLYAFPTLLHGVPTGDAAQAIVEEEETTCFNHPNKRAEVTCDTCGRFLCNTCDVEVRDVHCCPKCLAAACKTEGRYRTNFPRYDRLAAMLAFGPFFLFPLAFISVITAPIALVLVIRFWRYDAKPVKYERSMAILAFLFSALQVAGWAMLFVTLLADAPW
jgi:hypothetical protein